MSVTQRPVAELGRLTERLGSTLLTHRAGPLQPKRKVSTILLNDPLDPPDVEPDAIILCIGITGEDELAELVITLGAAQACALVVRDSEDLGESVIAEADRGGVSVFGLVHGASWLQAAMLIGGALNLGVDGIPRDGLETGRDLFTLADSLSALLRAPVTIEDHSSHVVAFSADQAGTDDPRRMTILGLRVPDIYSSAQRDNGVFRQVYASDRPLLFTEPAPGTLPRVAMRVQAGGETLGSIWAVVSEPLSLEQERGMIEASQVVALSILRSRVSADASQQLREAMTSKFLEGGTSAREAAQQLAIEPSAACAIVFGPVGDEDEVQVVADTHRASVALYRYLQLMYPRAVTAQLGGVVYAIIPVGDTTESTAASMRSMAAEFVSRLGISTSFCAGLGGIVADISELARSRREADMAMRVLKSRPQDGGGVARFSDVYIESLMLHISDSLTAEGIELGGPLRLLREYDTAHDMHLVATLRSWLEHLGDVSSAARAVHVHKNTFRYRLERVESVAGINLGDPDVRFGLMLQLRLPSPPSIRSKDL
ncbi:CdaR family transcriptional regulator [Arthrobacter sp. 4R501]|uniref:PucR family transcriptional regulator n=1 Tax=Arthrobacter sp. 4R501 TaxID=2058886 RepID=UPI000CE2CD07|nr:helix-turn-helix domain-containing protein [Arthrobacter sp. 4R501]